MVLVTAMKDDAVVPELDAMLLIDPDRRLSLGITGTREAELDKRMTFRQINFTALSIVHLQQGNHVLEIDCLCESFGELISRDMLCSIHQLHSHRCSTEHEIPAAFFLQGVMSTRRRSTIRASGEHNEGNRREKTIDKGYAETNEGHCRSGRR